MLLGFLVDLVLEIRLVPYPNQWRVRILTNFLYPLYVESYRGSGKAPQRSLSFTQKGSSRVLWMANGSLKLYPQTRFWL